MHLSIFFYLVICEKIAFNFLLLEKWKMEYLALQIKEKIFLKKSWGYKLNCCGKILTAIFLFTLWKLFMDCVTGCCWRYRDRRDLAVRISTWKNSLNGCCFISHHFLRWAVFVFSRFVIVSNKIHFSKNNNNFYRL